MLERDTDWRQGCIISDQDMVAVGLLKSPESNKHAIVISHDCDLPNSKEEIVEVIVGNVIAEADNMFTNARNPRRLHLIFSSSQRNVCIELLHSNRCSIQKSKFTKTLLPNKTLQLEVKEKQALKQWLAARYARPAFPNTFENRLRKKHRRKSVEEHISRILKPVSKHLTGVFFDLGEERTSELKKGESYFLKILLVYDATEGGQDAREIAESTASEIETLFHEAYQLPGSPENEEIMLEKCDAVADTFITLADLRKVDQWRIEYISLREDPPGDFFIPGENPI
ncbi:MAG: hypothetical protein OEX82_09405 [Nitrosomonas sp.]|nr:hypothetical protein [Nitrosomonas sp.]